MALLVTVVKLYFAATTAGTNDVFHFRDFARAVHLYGPVGIYGRPFSQPPYNHPPLIGWMLSAINFVTRTGLPFRFLIRLPATASDIISTLLVFELVRRGRSLLHATVAALAIAASPILIVISGFHGNTDPAFVMFSLLSFYLLVTGKPGTLAGIAAGLCFGVAISIKLVPIVVLPLLLVLALRWGWRKVAEFVAGAAVVFALLWVPVILQEWTPFKKNVLEYAGYGARPRWGLPEFLYAAGGSSHALTVLEGPGRFLAIVISAGIPALIAWRRPAASTLAFGISLSSFLLLSTATATQYLAWAAVPTVLVSAWLGALYNLTAGLLLVRVYDRWNHAYPWNWDRGIASPFSPKETIVAAVVWLILLAVIVVGIWYSWRSTPSAEAKSAGPGDDKHEEQEERSPKLRLAST